MTKQEAIVKYYKKEALFLPEEFLWEEIPNNVKRRYGFSPKRKMKGTRRDSRESWRKYKFEVFSAIEKEINKIFEEELQRGAIYSEFTTLQKNRGWRAFASGINWELSKYDN
jgi:hypothetical protein